MEHDMIPAILLSLVIMAESPDKLTPEAAAQLKEMRASMKVAVKMLEEGKYVDFVDRFISSVKDEFKGPGREERINKVMKEEGALDHFLSRCKIARDQPLLKWAFVKGTYLFSFEIKISETKKDRILIEGKGQTWEVR
jgi:hypothetical protein